MYLNQFLTEYDESLSSELNIDPLGLQVIWSAFGRAIFKNRINSISNDVRNYTLNLFHHYVIKSLLNDDSVTLGKALQNHYANKSDLNFKYACLIHMENLFVYSMIANQQRKGVETGGVLGISKARRKWYESDESPGLKFGHGSDCQVLVRQVMLGVSGRYKTPLTAMQFFDREYHYDLPDAAQQWEKTEALVNATPPLERLFSLLRQHLVEMIGQSGVRGLQINFTDVNEQLKSAYVEAFSSPALVGSYARDFWLGLTELDQGASGALYRELMENMDAKDPVEIRTSKLFILAMSSLPDTQTEEKTRLTHVCLLEPFLSELDLMFTLMLTHKSQTLDEAGSAWHGLGRDEQSLPKLASAIVDNTYMFKQLSDTGEKRLKQLLKVVDAGSVTGQMQALQSYHTRVMESRGQLPWVRIGDKQLTLYVKARKAPSAEERNEHFWVNNYYIPQFKNLLRGLWGKTA